MPGAEASHARAGHLHETRGSRKMFVYVYIYIHIRVCVHLFICLFSYSHMQSIYIPIWIRVHIRL